MVQKAREINTKDSHFWEVFGLYSLGKYSDAIAAGEKYEVILKNTEFAPRFFVLMGSAYWFMSRYDRSKEANEKAITLGMNMKEYKTVAGAQNNVGSYYTRRGEYEEAVKWYNEAIYSIVELYKEPSHPLMTSYNNLGEIYFQMGEYGKSMQFMNLRIEIMKELDLPKHMIRERTDQNRVVFGKINMNQGNLIAAEHYFQQALESRLNHNITHEIIDSYIALGEIYLLRGDLENAIGIQHKISELAELNHDDEISYNNQKYRAKVAMKNSDFSTALSLGTKALHYVDKIESKINSELGEIYHILIISNLLQGNSKIAWNHFDEYKSKILEKDLIFGIYNHHFLGHLNKYSIRLDKKYLAKTHFEEIVNSSDLNKELAVTAIHNILELLILEYQIINEVIVIEEILLYLELMREIAREGNMVGEIVRVLIFEAHTELMRSNIPRCDELIEQAQLIIEEQRLDHLNYVIKEIQDERKGVGNSNADKSENPADSLAKSFTYFMKEYPNQIDEILHPIRYKIISQLYKFPVMTRQELRENLDITQGSLSRHLSELEKNDIVVTDLRLINDRAQKVVSITNNGIILMKRVIADLT